MKKMVIRKHPLLNTKTSIRCMYPKTCIRCRGRALRRPKEMLDRLVYEQHLQRMPIMHLHEVGASF